MPRYRVTKKRYPLVDAGSLNCRITIYTRQITAPQGADVNYDETLTPLIVMWASVESVKGINVFDDTNLGTEVTHKIYIRKPTSSAINITSGENWIGYRNTYYRILDVEEMGMESRFLCLLVTSKGADSKAVNKA